MSYLQDIDRENEMVNKVRGLPLATIKRAIVKENGGRKASMAKILKKIGIDAIANLISEGAMVSQIARGLNIPVREVSRYLHAHERYNEVIPPAYEMAADMYATLATQILEDADLDKDSIARAKAQAGHYMQLAAHFGPNRFGGAKKTADADQGGGVTYNIVIGDTNAVGPTMEAIESKVL